MDNRVSDNRTALGYYSFGGVAVITGVIGGSWGRNGRCRQGPSRVIKAEDGPQPGASDFSTSNDIYRHFPSWQNVRRRQVPVMVTRNCQYENDGSEDIDKSIAT